MGRYWEEFNEGEEFLTPGRTITEADVVGFASLSGDHNELHTNAEYARRAGFPGPVPQVLLVLAHAAGLISRLGLFEGTAIGLLSLEWRSERPVQIGDTLRCRVRIARLEERGLDRGLVVREVEVLNQRDEVVHVGRQEVMVVRNASR
jgi:acyl dehydratase